MVHLRVSAVAPWCERFYNSFYGDNGRILALYTLRSPEQLVTSMLQVWWTSDECGL